MTTLYVDRKGLTCKFENKALIFFEDGQRCGSIPTIPLKRVVFYSSVTLDTSVLCQLGQQGVGITILSGRSHQPTLYLPSQTQDAHRRVAQYLLSEDDDYRTLMAQKLVHAKFSAQIEALKTLHKKYNTNVALENAISALAICQDKVNATTSISSLLGIEGHVATLYFQALATIAPPELKFQGRNRRPPKDPLNAILSLLYTLAYSEAAMIIHIAGLDPYVGFLHSLEAGRASFACDLIEALRPTIDLFALSLFENGTLKVEQFTQSSRGCTLSKEGRTVFYPAYEAEAKTWRLELQKQLKPLLTKLEVDYSIRKLATVPSTFEELDE